MIAGVLNMSREESFPVSEKVLQDFIELNKNKWNSENNEKAEKYIIINFSMVRMQFAWIIPKILYAKGLQEKTGAKPIAMTWHANERLTKFFESFGIEHINLDDLCNKYKLDGIKAGINAINIGLFHSNPEHIKNSKILGLPVGIDIYEDILRTSSLSTLRSCHNKTAIKKYMHIAWVMYAINEFGKRNKIEYAIVDDLAYHEGALIKLFSKLGATIMACSNVNYERVSFFDDGTIKKRMYVSSQKYKNIVDTITDENITDAEQLLKDRFAGKNGRDIDRGAFADKIILSKDETSDKLGLDKTKKTVAIMAHTFTDAVFNYGTYYFRDYYDWLDKTLEIAESVTDVNWVLKPHPTRKAYNESADSVEDMYERHKKPHIFWTGDEISGESIKNISDMVVTIGGNVGAEYSCFGIPCVIVGKPWYSGFGYTIEPESFEEYKKYLQNASSVERLNDEQIKTAKKLFYIRCNNNFFFKVFNDELAILLNNCYEKMKNKMAISYFINDDGTEKYNDYTLMEYIQYIDKNDVKDSQYYCAGKVIR